MSKRTSFCVVGIGEILWDIYRESRYLGGAPTNVVVHAAQLGDEGIIVSRIGNDGMGKELIRALKEKGVITDFLQIDKKKGTGTVHISLSVSGEPSFFCTEDVAFDYIQFNAELEKLARRTDAVVFGTLAQRNGISRNTILSFLDAVGGVRLFDVNARMPRGDFAELVKASLQRTDILKTNRQELNLLKQIFHKEGDSDLAFSRFLMELYKIRFVVLTRGAEGAAIIDQNEAHVRKALPVAVVDSTGAGDAFAAAIVHKYLRNAEPEDMLDFATRLAAYVCTKKSATPPVDENILKAFAHNG